jgi:hypothetical protein
VEIIKLGAYHNHSPNKNDLLNMFNNISTAETRSQDYVKVRFQGLSDKQVIISFSTLTGSISIKFYEENLISILKSYFEQQWESCVEQ